MLIDKALLERHANNISEQLEIMNAFVNGDKNLLKDLHEIKKLIDDFKEDIKEL